MPEEEVPEEPIVKTYAYGGYELTAEILTGRAVLTYPAAVTDADAEAFIAYENAAYDLADAGVTYSLEGDGVAVFTYPETISREAAAAELDVSITSRRHRLRSLCRCQRKRIPKVRS